MTVNRKLVLAVLLTIIPVSALAADVEARCSSLGSQCMCSETLDVNDNLPANLNPQWNPTNSITKQCGDGCGLVPPCDGPGVWMGEDYTTKSQTIRANNVQPFPSGANPYVYQGSLYVSSGSGIQHMNFDIAHNVSSETICTRVYRYFNPDVPDTLPDDVDRIKLDGHQFVQDGTNPGVVLAYTTTQLRFGNQIPLGAAYVQWVMDVGPYSIPDPVNGNFVDYAAKSQAGWVRQELCSDVGIAGSGTIQMRSRMNFLSDGSEVTHTSDVITGGPSVIDVIPGASSMTAEGPTIVGAPSSARQYMSHYMQARVPLDSNFWIGAASELESNVPRPPAPVLLDE